MYDYINREELIANLKRFAPEHYTDLIDQIIRNQPAEYCPICGARWTEVIRMDNRMNVQSQLRGMKEALVGYRYRHFKGGVYIVTALAVHSETEEPMVIYKNFDDPSLV